MNQTVQEEKAAVGVDSPPQTDDQDKVGKAGAPIFAMAFPGGAGDAIMQLGVIHALLVSERKPPDVVAGVSAGAFNAAALAEIFREPSPERKVARFREFLNATVSAPREFQRSFFPDPYEIDAHAPLESINLPIHSSKERELRRTAALSMAGIIRLFNDVLSMRLKVSSATVLAHRWLALTAAGEEPNRLARHYKRVWAIIPILLLAPISLWHIRRLSWQLFAALFLWGPTSLHVGLTAGDMISPLYRAGRWLKRQVQDACGYAIGFVAWCLGIVGLVLYVAWFHFAYLPGFALARVLGSKYIRFRNPKPLIKGLSRVLRKFLERYDLAREVGSSHTLEQFLIQLFDRNYYGTLQMNEVVDAALLRKDKTAERRHTDRRTFDDYKKDDSGAAVHVAAVVGDVATGKVTSVPGTEPVVKGLLAAMAVVPLFSPVYFNWIRVDDPGTSRFRKGQSVNRRVFEKEYLRVRQEGGVTPKGSPLKAAYIDAMNLANEPIYALLDYIRDRLHEDAPVVYLYPVAAFPASKSELHDGQQEKSGLVDVVIRVLTLGRFRSAALERKLMTLYTRILPDGKARHFEENEWSRPHVSAYSFPIEPERPLLVNERIAMESDIDRKSRVILKTVAHGCRLTLESLIKVEALAQWPRGGQRVQSDGSVPCGEALETLSGYSRKKLPGSDTVGPGVAEVCRMCSFKVGKTKHRASLKVQEREAGDEFRPEWPSLSEPGGQPDSSAGAPGSDGGEKKGDDKPALRPEREYRPPDKVPASNEPWVCVLLSGGVFRGVFQVGVLNGLNQAKLTPTLFAGSSVGSVMAAMALRCFQIPEPGARQVEITRLAATFLGLDRLILTDRFADFVRRFTIRAGATELSPRDADVLFRRYDAGRSAEFESDARRVIAGLERLLYISPFELKEIVKAIRHENIPEALRRLKLAVQNLLERNNVGVAILGAEPLELLIAQHVLQEKPSPHRVTFEEFLGNNPKQRHLLVTATDLIRGRLHIVGKEAAEGKPVEGMLLPALLASSAFPAVFRPRHSSEVFPSKGEASVYVDGGVMDNLPLDAVASFLDQAAVNGLTARRPLGGSRPHLLLTASLEPICRDLDRAALEEVCSSWPLLMKRIRELSYNKKVDAFADVQRHFKEILKKSAKDGWKPVDLEVVTVKPHWLCKTFGFHPMLGFRRRRQAASIAHGCASTLARLAVLKDDYTIQEAKQNGQGVPWGLFRSENPISLNENLVDSKTFCAIKDEQTGQLLDIELKPNQAVEKGRCWFRSEVCCPFSESGLKDSQIPRDSPRYELLMIYQLCGQPETHQAP